MLQRALSLWEALIEFQNESRYKDKIDSRKRILVTDKDKISELVAVLKVSNQILK